MTLSHGGCNGCGAHDVMLSVQGPMRGGVWRCRDCAPELPAWKTHTPEAENRVRKIMEESRLKQKSKQAS